MFLFFLLKFSCKVKILHIIMTEAILSSPMVVMLNEWEFLQVDILVMVIGIMVMILHTMDMG